MYLPVYLNRRNTDIICLCELKLPGSIKIKHEEGFKAI